MDMHAGLREFLPCFCPYSIHAGIYTTKEVLYDIEINKKLSKLHVDKAILVAYY